MNNPPKEALIKIKEYCCENSCLLCNYAQVYSETEIACSLIESPPCYWDVKIGGIENAKNNTS